MRSLATLLHRHGIGCRGRDGETAPWHVAAAEALIADGVNLPKKPRYIVTPPVTECDDVNYHIGPQEHRRGLR